MKYHESRKVCFSQLTEFLPKRVFENIVIRYCGDKGVRIGIAERVSIYLVGYFGDTDPHFGDIDPLRF
ncbi:MAG: hypothetical protein U0W24_04315 [Bacteroidales bacterium]